jgi:hypothetical protein
MTGAGIIPFRSGPKSDHASIYADFSLATLCDLPSQSLHDPTHPSSRNLWSTDIKAVEAYVKRVQAGFESDNISECIAILIDCCQWTDQCTTEDERILNHINIAITKILIHAEAHCKHAKGHAWLPLLANAGRAVIAAKWHLSDLLNGRTHAPLFDRARAIIQAKAKVKEAYALLRQVQQNGKHIRNAFLEDRAEHLANTRNIDKATALRQLIRAERQSAIFKRLGIWLKATEYVNLNRILTPDDPTDLENTTWTAIIEAQALYEVLIAHAQEHFKQAANTPFINGPIAAQFGPFADNSYCDAILNGTIDLAAIANTTEVKDLLHGM